MAEGDDPPEFPIYIFEQPPAEFEPRDLGAGPAARAPRQMRQLPEHTRKWIGGLTPERIARLEQLDRLADETDLDRLVELADIAEKAATLRRFGKWAVASMLAGFLLLPPLVDAADRVWGWLKGASR